MEERGGQGAGEIVAGGPPGQKICELERRPSNHPVEPGDELAGGADGAIGGYIRAGCRETFLVGERSASGVHRSFRRGSRARRSYDEVSVEGCEIEFLRTGRSLLTRLLPK